MRRNSDTAAIKLRRMSLSIYVEAYSGHRANERPLRFWVDPMIEEHGGVSGVFDNAEDLP